MPEGTHVTASAASGVVVTTTGIAGIGGQGGTGAAQARERAQVALCRAPAGCAGGVRRGRGRGRGGGLEVERVGAQWAPVHGLPKERGSPGGGGSGSEGGSSGGGSGSSVARKALSPKARLDGVSHRLLLAAVGDGGAAGGSASRSISSLHILAKCSK